MIHRSQIFVRYKEDGERKMVARQYPMNYGECMISRARYGIAWIKSICKYIDEVGYKLYRVLDTNFDMGDCTISSNLLIEYVEDDLLHDTLNDFMFNQQSNDNGKLLIDILPDGTIKYSFLDCDNEKVMSAAEYMDWDMGEKWTTPTKYMSQKVIDTCKRNIEDINKMAVQMTEDEVREFMEFDYSYLLENVSQTFCWKMY